MAPRPYAASHISARNKAAAALQVSRSWGGHEPGQEMSGELSPPETVLEVERLTWKSN